MDAAPHLLVIYQQLLVLSQTMLRLAAENKWDELIDMEVHYISAVETLSDVTQQHPVSLHTQEQLRPVLRHILDNEAEVKRLLQLRMDELVSLIGHSNRHKAMNSAYGELSGTVLYPSE
ncbi:flagellar biosynthesis protein FliT [[Pantoea] beijingensis]|uniref:Flagellar protein FliT n=1 Tax=[Pantoea] beijingensis TaxID=1324864 RepID=A0A443IIR6_9GAMM|nr:flagella biosynthesis regulatory protein FliT [[Pantoea] beijingensis]RWR03901.1 flagellar biosynthesis protein FliT [[Pantoea] beijingensis]